MNATIRADFASALALGGTPVTNATTGHDFRALIVNSEQDAEFSTGEQKLTESCSLTCHKEDSPTTGHVLTIEGDTWVVSAVSRRYGSPIVRVHIKLQTAADHVKGNA